MFKRRVRPSLGRRLLAWIYPPGGYRRATRYVMLRLRRLPDLPERIARGVAAGVFLAFTPFYGLHLIITFIVALVFRANVLAAVLASFISNPLTWPLIIAAALGTGEALLGRFSGVAREGVLAEFGQALGEVFRNIAAIFTPAQAHWDRLALFWHDIFLPYLVGGGLLGVIFSTIAFFASLRALRAYRKHRIERLNHLGAEKA